MAVFGNPSGGDSSDGAGRSREVGGKAADEIGGRRGMEGGKKVQERNGERKVSKREYRRGVGGKA